MNVFAGNGLYSFSFSLSKRNKIKAHELIDHLGGELFPHLLTFFFFSIGQGQVMTWEVRWQGVGKEGKSIDHEEPLGHLVSVSHEQSKQAQGHFALMLLECFLKNKYINKITHFLP